MDRQVGSGGMAGQRQGPIVSLVLETTQIFFKVGHVLLFLLDHFSRSQGVWFVLGLQYLTMVLFF